MTTSRTYLDHNATAPLRPAARTAMVAALDLVGNASSVHAEGRAARAVIETAREQLAALVAVRPSQVVFTSGATEANNWALSAGWRSIALAGIEHESVLAPARASAARIIELPVGSDGRVEVASVAHACEAVGDNRSPASRRGGEADRAAGRGLITLQLANSETGVLQPVAQVASAARPRGCVMHTDAVQAAGRVALGFAALGVDLMSLSAHKLGGPKGIGALVVREGLELTPFMRGGAQERRQRAGTENVAAIAGFGVAAEQAAAELADIARVARLRDRLESEVAAIAPSAVIVGAGAPRLPNTSCIAMPGAEAAMLLIKLDLAGIAVSAGSACSSGKIGGSHVLTAMGLAKSLADAAIRVSIGAVTTEDDIARFLAAWARIHGATGRVGTARGTAHDNSPPARSQPRALAGE